MTDAGIDVEVVVPWRTIPVSEPVLPGEFADQFKREKGWPIWHPALVSVVAAVLTSEAHKLLAEGAVTIDGEPAARSFSYIKPGALIEVAGKGRYRIGHIEPPRY